MDQAQIRCLFDRFALGYDRVLAALDYRGPLVLGRALQALDVSGARVCDAGCGTGLAGPALAPSARVLLGVDLSGPMLARAARRGCYTSLVQGDFLQVLGGACWDLIAAVDSWVYLAELGAAAAAAAAGLRNGGRLIVTLERHSGDLVVPSAGGRYAHGAAAIELAAKGAGLRVEQLEPVESLRLERRQPVPGWLLVAQRRPDA